MSDYNRATDPLMLASTDQLLRENPMSLAFRVGVQRRIRELQVRASWLRRNHFEFEDRDAGGAAFRVKLAAKLLRAIKIEINRLDAC